MAYKKPRILLIGAGSFGLKHLKTLRDLEKQNLLEIAGIVVKTKSSQEKLQKEQNLPVFCEITDSLLENVDAVDIVTPAQTHLDIIEKCISKTHVFVEKPLISDIEDSKKIRKIVSKSDKVLMVGHIFRFHPAVLKLKSIIEKTKFKPHLIESHFINPLIDDTGRNIEFEMLHPFDIVDFLFNKKIAKKHSEQKNRVKTVAIVYKGGMHALFKLGWFGQEKDRFIKLTQKNRQIFCDLMKNTVKIYRNGLLEESHDLNDQMLPLEAELRSFLDIIKTSKNKIDYPNIDIGLNIVKIASLHNKENIISNNEKTDKKINKKKIAIIGAGIFGTNCAIELAPFADVTIYEKNSDILTEASFINQYRHHWGYHYPRSQETVSDILHAIKDFEDRYNGAIVREFPTYYSVAKENTKVDSKQYMEFCDRNNLPYTIEYPDEKYLNREKTEICLKTFEPIYNFSKLKEITKTLLKKTKVKLKLKSEVVDAYVLEDGKKVLKIKKDGKIVEESFDYVINVTYARYNNFCNWLGFPKKPIRLDLVETLWVKLNLPKISLAVMDGAFTNIVPTGKDGVFTLVHIKESVLRRFVPKDGLVPKNIFDSSKNSRIKRIIEKSMEWFPIVKDLKILKVHYVLRGVNAFREHDDARTSDIAEHGFGCFSILGGKIINSVTIAKKMVDIIVK